MLGSEPGRDGPMTTYIKGDRVQLRVGSRPRGTVQAKVFPGLYDVIFDRKDTLGRKRWLCDLCELEPAMVCRPVGLGNKRDGSSMFVSPESREGAK